jgi:purine-nucleoside phosphorylase
MARKALKQLNEAVKYLKKKYKYTPEVGIVLGSGLGNFSEEIEIEKEIDYSDIPNFPVSTVEGHKGKLIFGNLSGKKIVCMGGRFHFYEGYSAAEVIFPIRVLGLLGIKTLLLSNAAGGVNPAFKVGDIMIINDHIGIDMVNPLIGRNIDVLGPRFPDMSEAYNKGLIKKAKQVAANLEIEVKEGVYFCVSGPTYETPAEYKMIHIIGGDAVGMSTVQECIIANHMNIPVFAMSVITDMGLGHEYHTKITHEEVLHFARAAEPKLAAIFKELIAVL